MADLLFCLSLVAAVLFTWANRYAIPDDAYIYLRVAENIAAGDGWGFNAGHVHNSTTSPLHTVILAVFGLTGLNGANLLLFTWALGLLTLLVSVYAAFRPVQPATGGWLCLALSLWFNLYLTIGLETCTMLAALAASALAFQRGLLLWAGFAAGCVALARPEGLVLLPILVALHILLARRIGLPLLVGFLSVAAIWVVASLWMFETLIPHTARIKGLQSNIAWWASSGSWISYFYASSPALPFWLALAPFGLVRVVADAREGRPFAAIIIFYGLAQTTAYSVLGAPVGYWWYLIPGGLAIVVASVLGVATFVNTVAGFLSVVTRSRLWVGRIAPIFFVVYAVGVFLTPLVEDTGDVYRLSDEYRDIADWLARNASPGDWVAVDEIGYIGYYSGLNVRDKLGLLHPEALKPMAAQDWGWWVRTEPEFVVTHEPRWIGEPGSKDYPFSPEDTSAFAENYVAVHETEALTIHRRLTD